MFKKKDIAKKQAKEDRHFRPKKKITKQKLSGFEGRQRIKIYLQKAGLDITQEKLSRTFHSFALPLDIILSFFLLYYTVTKYGLTFRSLLSPSVIFLILILAGMMLFVYFLLIILMWIVFYAYTEVRIYRRKLELEEVLPDFLKLTSSNINAGMTVDRALWFAVRPRFGVLAREIEMVAKQTMGGMDLKASLVNFSIRFDSVILKRAISMINEGIEAGGEIGYLLNKVALDIEDQRALLKEMSANVTTYVIFISFASVVAAPFLFAMSGVLIDVVQKISANLSSVGNVGARLGIPLDFSGASITQNDFRTFTVVSLSLTSLFSAMMVSTIKKGNIKSGLKLIPVFMLISLAIYFTVRHLSSGLVGLFF